MARDVKFRLIADTASFQRNVSMASQKLGQFASSAAAAGAGLTAAVTLPLTAMAAAAIKASSQFDRAMTSSLAIMGNVSKAMREDMAKSAREMAKTSTFSANQAAESYFFLASAGLDAKQSLAALPTVTKFAQAGMFDMALATDLLTDAQSALGMTIRDDVVANMENMNRVSDVLVKANTLANATVQQFSEALTNKAGAALKVFGKDVEEGVAVLAALADQGVKGQIAGNNLSIVIRNLTTAAAQNEGAFDRMGVRVFDNAGKFNDFATIIGDLEKALAGQSDEMKKNTLLQLGFADRAQATLLTLLGTSDAIRRYDTELRKAGGTTSEIAEKQLKTFSAQWDLFKSRVTDVAITLGGALVPVLQDVVDAMGPVVEFAESAAESFAALPKPLQAAAVGLGALVAAAGPLLLGAGGMAFALKGIADLILMIGSAKVVAGINGLAAGMVKLGGISLAGFAGWKVGRGLMDFLDFLSDGGATKAVDKWALEFVGGLDIIKQGFKDLKESYLDFWREVKEKGDGIVDAIADGTKDAVNGFPELRSGFQTLMQTASGMPPGMVDPSAVVRDQAAATAEVNSEKEKGRKITAQELALIQARNEAEARRKAELAAINDEAKELAKTWGGADMRRDLLLASATVSQTGGRVIESEIGQIRDMVREALAEGFKIPDNLIQLLARDAGRKYAEHLKRMQQELVAFDARNMGTGFQLTMPDFSAPDAVKVDPAMQMAIEAMSKITDEKLVAGYKKQAAGILESWGLTADQIAEVLGSIEDVKKATFDWNGLLQGTALLSSALSGKFADLPDIIGNIAQSFSEATTSADKFMAIAAGVGQIGGLVGGKAGNAIQGAAGGAMAGFTMGGPAGAVIGGAVGFLGGLFGGGGPSKEELAQQRQEAIDSTLASLAEIQSEMEQIVKDSAMGGVGGLAAMFTHAAESADFSAERIENLGIIGFGVFQSLRESGMSWIEAVEAMGPALDAALAAVEANGGELTGGFGALVGFQGLVQENEALVAAAEGAGAALEGLRLTGSLTQETFNAMQAEIQALFQELLDAGFTATQAFQILGPAIFGASEAAADFGFSMDEGMQGLIEDAEQVPGLFESMTDPMDRLIELQGLMLQAVGALVQAIGGELPAAVQAYIDSINAIPPIPAPPSGGGGGGGGGEFPDSGRQPGDSGASFQTGFFSPSLPRPMSFTAHQGEQVSITPPMAQFGGGGGGGDAGGGGEVILMVDGERLGRIIGKLSRTQRMKIHPIAVKEF